MFKCMLTLVKYKEASCIGNPYKIYRNICLFILYSHVLLSNTKLGCKKVVCFQIENPYKNIQKNMFVYLYIFMFCCQKLNWITRKLVCKVNHYVINKQSMWFPKRNSTQREIDGFDTKYTNNIGAIALKICNSVDLPRKQRR